MLGVLSPQARAKKKKKEEEEEEKKERKLKQMGLHKIIRLL